MYWILLVYVLVGLLWVKMFLNWNEEQGDEENEVVVLVCAFILIITWPLFAVYFVVKTITK